MICEQTGMQLDLDFRRRLPASRAVHLITGDLYCGEEVRPVRVAAVTCCLAARCAASV